MKPLLFFIIFYFSLFNNNQNVINNENPKFKSIKEAVYYAKRTGLIDRKTALEKNITEFNEYNKLGDLISSLKFETDGSLFEKTTSIFNENGKLLKSIVNDSNETLKEYSINEFDSNGKLITVKTYDPNNILLKTLSYKYDLYGNCIESIYINFQYENKIITKYKYNSKNQVLEETSDNKARKEKTNRNYIYDKIGNQIEEYMNCSDGRYIKFLSEYDTLNNKISEKWFDKNNIKEHEVSFEYVYDNYHNWITKKRFLNGQIDFVWEREIQYY